MSDLLPHPLAELFPMLPEAEIALLADDICTNGLNHPIVLYEGKILDGRNRLAACEFGQLEPSFVDYAGDDPLGFVLSENLRRRHLTESQRAMVAAQIVDWEVGFNQHSGGANLPAHKAAERLSISERAVKAAKRIRDHGAVELVQAIRDGRVSVHAGEALSDLALEAQREVLAREEKQIVARAKEIRAERQRLRHTVRVAHLDMVATRGQATAPVWWKAGQSGPTYPIIYADPPWKFLVHSEVTGREKSAENHYPTMDLPAILELGSPAAKNAALFLWVTDLANGLACMQAWGFAFKSFWGWEKQYPGRQLGTGYWSFDNLELLLIGTRGDFPAPLPGTQPQKLTAHPVAEHSAKPDFFAEQIERLWPGVPRLEMFCRSPRPGWDAWGFETGEAEQQVPKEAWDALEAAEKSLARLKRGRPRKAVPA
ncbi:MT-A70 family methyltransferase [Mesorhizobium sp. YC-39]|nr:MULTISPECIES: MT-A70 family methyltransferase [unclassified Mesorhizobium]MCV3209625.1 MT-A70 family methyltransferase [Mesorhizobium sp. YC-2]MCV3230155.1 MT-A70 family methyltransferase [Mesorhizobium sp. YC-39]